MFVSRNCSKRPQPAVAIVLKRLLHELSKIGLDHADESSIRMQLRKRSDCKSTAIQYFLVKGSTSTKIDRKGTDTKNTSCVIIPRSDVPERSFQIIEGSYMQALWFTLLLCTYCTLEREKEQIDGAPSTSTESIEGI